MTDPQIPTKLLERLFSLKTPVAERILELMLLLVLMCGAGYVFEHGPQLAKFVVIPIFAVSTLITYAMLFRLLEAVIGPKAKKPPADKS
jgi:hypothetical protein